MKTIAIGVVMHRGENRPWNEISFSILAKIKNGKKGIRYVLLGSADYDPANPNGWSHFRVENNWGVSTQPLRSIEDVIHYVMQRVEDGSHFRFYPDFYKEYEDKIKMEDRRLAG